MAGMDHAGTSGNRMAMPMATDLNDVEYDAFLVDDRTLDDPLVVASSGAGERGSGSSTAPRRARSGSSSVSSRAA